MRSALLALALLPALAFSHSGGVDKNGGHSKGGEYHCHTMACTGTLTKKDPVEEAKAEGRPFSLVYRRDDWKHWSDFDRDCMNTRHEALLQQADGPVKLSPNGCYVNTGTWQCPFGGATLHRASDLDVDHVIPLSWAHSHGGAEWSAKKKEQFANDYVNLVAAHDKVHSKKGDRGPNEWMPPRQEYRCEYLLKWQNVLTKYPDLKMTPAESRVFARQLKACMLSQ